MDVENSFELLSFLKAQNLLAPLDLREIENPKNWWWPNALSFEVILSAILVQNTRWEQVQAALTQFTEKNTLSLESLSAMPIEKLQDSFKNIGLFRQKALRIQVLCQNILRDFGDYPNFCAQVSRSWLLGQKGIGLETCDAILNYGLGRECVVADSYTQRLLSHFGYTLESYAEVQEWLRIGIVENEQKVCALYGCEIPLALVFARLHGKIVEYSKRNNHAKNQRKISEF